MREKKFKRCPRCDTKADIFQERCENCGLIYARLSKASNSAAKKALKRKEYKKVIMDKVLPRDVNKWKLFFIALFFGWFGLHYAKVGRYKLFIYTVVTLAMLLIASCLPASWFNMEYLGLLMWFLILPPSFGTILWVVSIFQIAFNTFKVPISIDEDYVKEDLDQKLVKDILNEVKQNENIASKGHENNNMQNGNSNKQKREKIKIVCASCGTFVKVYKDEKICPKCDEPLYDEDKYK